MENIQKQTCDTEKEEIAKDIESDFTSVFQQLVEVTEVEKNPSRKSSSSSDLSGKDPDEAQGQSKKSQTDSTIVQRNLELHLSAEAQQKIQDILNDVRQLSEKEKLLLYLKLPTKAGSLAEESQPIPLSNTRQEQTQAFQWIRSNLEECETSYTLPKHEVYDDYKSFCESLGANRTLSAPDFGKIIKCVFPRVKARRLGTRGNSKYCYSGLRKKIVTESPSLPNLNGNGGEVNNNESANKCNEITEDQTLSAACDLVCEWANKLLGRVFSTLLDLARFLVGGSYVSTKSMAAFVVMSATESKIRKMSEKLQFWPSARSSSDKKSTKNEERKSPSRTAVPCDYNIASSKTKSSPSNQTGPKAFLKGQSYNGTVVKTERPQSLPGIPAVTGNSDFSKVPSQLMSPPPCPPPKAPYQTAKGSPLGAVPSSVFSVAAQSRVNNPNINSIPQITDGIFPSSDSNVNGIQKAQQMILQQNNMAIPFDQHQHRRGHISRAPSMLRRSESCPYPAQSPRKQRHQLRNSTAGSLSPQAPLDVSRVQSWQNPLGSPHRPIIQEKPNTANQQLIDTGEAIRDQITSPVHHPIIQEAMTTPTDRQPLTQRCHSVPAPFSTPQTDVYHPLTPQIGGQLSSSLMDHRSPSHVQLRGMRNKVINNEIQSTARRNLTPFLTGNGHSNAVKINNDGAEVRNMSISGISLPGGGGSSTVTGSIDNRSHSIDNRSHSIDNRSHSIDFNDLDGVSDARRSSNASKSRMDNADKRRDANNSRRFDNTRERPVNNASAGKITGCVQERKQAIDMGLAQEAQLVSMDNLIDSTFSLGDLTTSSGNGLSDLDGLDDAVTMDLLRTLNSGNNIWATEWNSTGIQLMESS